MRILLDARNVISAADEDQLGCLADLVARDWPITRLETFLLPEPLPEPDELTTRLEEQSQELAEKCRELLAWGAKAARIDVFMRLCRVSRSLIVICFDSRKLVDTERADGRDIRDFLDDVKCQLMALLDRMLSSFVEYIVHSRDQQPAIACGVHVKGSVTTTPSSRSVQDERCNGSLEVDGRSPFHKGRKLEIDRWTGAKSCSRSTTTPSTCC